MLKYFLRRLLFSIPTLLAISMVVFGILALAPGDPMGEFAANPAITEAVRENIRKSLGLDQPLPARYVQWLLAFLQGDMAILSPVAAQFLPSFGSVYPQLSGLSVLPIFSGF